MPVFVNFIKYNSINKLINSCIITRINSYFPIYNHSINDFIFQTNMILKEGGMGGEAVSALVSHVEGRWFESGLRDFGH